MELGFLIEEKNTPICFLNNNIKGIVFEICEDGYFIKTFR